MNEGAFVADTLDEPNLKNPKYITQVASYGKCRKTAGWALNKAYYRSQWIDKSTAHVQGWLGYVYPSRASWTTSNLGKIYKQIQTRAKPTQLFSSRGLTNPFS